MERCRDQQFAVIELEVRATKILIWSAHHQYSTKDVEKVLDGAKLKNGKIIADIMATVGIFFDGAKMNMNKIMPT